ncbi:MAG: hypothetical protein IT567_05175 [Alphaproteobacteria bacterium]|nr:hypothetical protein [Alphaproteobacteria bacterium]
MKKALVVVMLVMLAACSSSGSSKKVEFTPVTMEGANCKAKCAQSAVQCESGEYSCRSVSNACMQSCQELDALSAGPR